MNYTDSAAIAAYLGVTFTPEQAARADAVAAAVTTFVDRYTGRTWQGTSPAPGELANVVPSAGAWPGAFGIVYLQHRPAVGVLGIALRSPSPHPTSTVLMPDQFELVDPTNGVVTLTGAGGSPYPGLVAVVDYEYVDAVPADIALAATMIAAGEMGRQLAIAASSAFAAAHPETAGLKSVSVGQNDVAVSFASTSASSSGGAAAGAALAPEGSAARAILDTYKRVVIS